MLPQRFVHHVSQHGAASPAMVAAAAAAPTSVDTTAHTLLLSPSTSLATPRGWGAVSSMPKLSSRYDEVHCVGGGSLLLFLLFAAGKAPRLRPGGKVIFHGPIVHPTASSCSSWLNSLKAGSGKTINEYEWRSSAVSLGVGGALHEPFHQWLEPITKDVAAGRTNQLVDRFNDLQRRSEQKGRLEHIPTASKGPRRLEAAVLQSLCQAAGTPNAKLLRCGEFECADETESCQLVYGA